MYPQGVCRIRKPACAGNGCAIFPTFEAARIGKKIRYPAADDLFRVSLSRQHESLPLGEGARGTRADEGKQAGIPSSVSRLRETREPPLHYGAISTGNC